MKHALISVSDKSKLIPFVQVLIQKGYHLLSTGGTFKYLIEHGIPALQVSEYTGFPEILDGRVKTLHPYIHAGLLARGDLVDHLKTLEELKIELIDLVVVNLYPFEQTIQKEAVTEEEAIEQIDIGGPSMLRSAAKNMARVTVITDIKDYERVIEEIKDFGDTTLETRKYLAKKVFLLTSHYDQVIANYLTNEKTLTKTWKMKEMLRYGENPHQKAYLYQDPLEDPYSLFQAKILHGKQLSYNNIQDANAAINLLKEFDQPCVVALKHMNPCGVGVSDTIESAYLKAYQSDDVSIFGGIVAVNREVTLTLAKVLNETFLEIIIAPSYSEDALLELMKKKNLRLIELKMDLESNTYTQITSINGGILVQDIDTQGINPKDLVLVTNIKPSPQMIEEMLFAWKIVKHVKSNAIVLTKNKQTIGVGAGQMNRVGAAKIAFEWAKSHGHHEGIILASDAFFPFDDIVELAKSYGITGIIQPGGSVRDQDSIDKANELGIPMVFTGIRHFKH
jgi:phosphoribosylaminoimidazolecarboxamide formyltransferase/IMP cyclohydrolase